MINIDPRIIKARSALILDAPFFGSLAMRLQVIADETRKTMATDGRRLLYSTAFLDTVTASQLKFVVAHEVMHCAMNHHTRRGERDPKQWNVACDYVVNLILKQAGFDLPEWVLLDESFEGLGAEAVYRTLDAKKKQDEQQQQEQQQSSQQGGDKEEGQIGESQPDDKGDQDGEGSDDAGNSGDDDAEGEGNETSGDQPGDSNADEGPSDPGGCGEILDAAPEHDEGAIAEAEAEWEVAVRQAVNVAKKQNAGIVPGFLQEVVADLAAPRTDWREVLRRFVDPSSTKNYSWARPNRRLMSQGYFNPGLISDGINHVAILIDTSGSVDQAALKIFGGETQAALEEGAIDKVSVVFIDTRVNRVAEYVRGDRIDFTVQGRGGTAFSPGLAWVNENAPDVAAAIYFTDLDCDDFGEEPQYPVLWAAYGDPRFLKDKMSRVPFGECIELPI